LNGGAWLPTSRCPHRGVGVPGILSGNAMTEVRVTKRAVSDDFGSVNASREQDLRSQISSEGALLGSAPGEAGLDVASASPVHRCGGGYP
jgi:hypothetical protein